MFVYTVYGVTGIPGRVGSPRVERVTPVTATHPVARSQSAQRALEERSRVRVPVAIAPANGQSDERPSSYEEMFQQALKSYQEPTQSTSINFLENSQPLVLAYRQPRTAESLDIASRRQALDQLRRDHGEIQDPDTLAWIV